MDKEISIVNKNDSPRNVVVEEFSERRSSETRQGEDSLGEPAFQALVTRSPRTLTSRHSSLTVVIFSRIMACETAKEAWDKLNEEFEGTMAFTNLDATFDHINDDIEEMKWHRAKHLLVPKFVCEIDHALFRFNILFEDDINTPKEPSGENDGISFLEVYRRYANPIWCDNIPPKDENLFLEDVSTLMGKECVVSEMSTLGSTLGVHDDQFTLKCSSLLEHVNSVLKNSQVSYNVYRIDLDNALDSLYILCGNRIAISFSHRDHVYFKKYGHIEKYYRQKQNQSGQSSQQVNFMEDHKVEKTEEEVFIALHTSCVDRYNWYVDNACTRHIAIDKSLFVSLDGSNRTKVKLGDGALVQAQGRESVKFPTDEEQDGVFERKNVTVMEMEMEIARYMLAEKKMPKYFWAKRFAVDESSQYYWNRDIVVKNQHGNTSIVAQNPKTTDISSGPISRAGHFSNVEMTTDSLVLKTSSLAKVYEQCKFDLVEPFSFAEAASHEAWISEMEEELAIVNKNDFQRNVVVEEFSEWRSSKTRQGDDSLVQYYPHSMSFASSNETDQKALLDFRNLITIPGHFLAINWTKNTCFCSWFDVTCSTRRQRVVALALPNLHLQGTISPSLANLLFLSVVNLWNNSLHGDIPYSLGHFPSLRIIDIRNNQLQGSIPTSLFQHQKVQKISLAFNKLGGEMWKGTWNVPKLSVLNLRNISLTGIIPPPVGNATKLMNFSLSGNRINGNIPKDIGNLSQLASLVLHDIQLTGSIPTLLFNISALVVVSLALNSLSGSLLLDEGNIVSNLKYLSISKNQISGCIPSNICQLRELKGLSISYNKITGDIPRNIGCLSKLEDFYLGENSITGTIPTSMGNISTHQNLFCGKNRLVERNPPELEKLSNLRQLYFAQNDNLIGQIPEAIFNISSLEIIAFNLNNLTGRIPATTGLHLPNLKEVNLGVNQLEGEIPLFITNASKLEILMLNNNFLTGTDAILDDNPFNGVLPNSIGNLSSTIENFYISDALINGLIPPGIGNTSSLTELNFGGNNLAGSIHSEIAGNNLTGEIPEFIGNRSMLQLLPLFSNILSSELPLSIWKMSGLPYLDMSQNCIEGEFPSDIGELKAIIKLDFSSTIPKSMGRLSYLKSINVSFNDLEGEIPSGGVFVNSTVQSFLGNKGLCGVHILEVPACTNPGLQSKFKELVLKVVIPVVISFFRIFLLVSIWIFKRQKKGKSKDVEKVPDIRTHQLVSYHETQRATNYFDESNLIGVGSSGSLYKGTLSSGIVVAIMILDLEYEERRLPIELLRRVTVMLDAAMGIEYLHHGRITPIVHCDLKPANIHLDEDIVTTQTGAWP
ncbi:putative LRR receptor-like serine/threonine-protein kinase-like [Capsicum annuum]|nr:putative LRR receptor-like serine/threonine-protein kinase-like [Capsicum annuum]